MKTSGLTLALSLALCSALAAQQTVAPQGPPPARGVNGYPTDRDAQRLVEMAAVDARRGDPLERFLIAPDVIMRRQREIGLQPAQRTQITQAIQRLEASLVELQWNMQDQQQTLAEMLQQPQVNTEAALAALDRVLNTEAAVKRTHFQALLTIRNVLTPEQLNQLQGVREVRGSLIREREDER